MAAEVGRKLLLKRNAVTIASLRTKSMSFGDEPIDITTDDDDGWRTLLEDGGQRQLDISADGVAIDQSLIQAIVNGPLITSFELEFPDGATITGSARLNSVEFSAEYQDAISFSTEIQSTGTYVYAP